MHHDDILLLNNTSRKWPVLYLYCEFIKNIPELDQIPLNKHLPLKKEFCIVNYELRIL